MRHDVAQGHNPSSTPPKGEPAAAASDVIGGCFAFRILTMTGLNEVSRNGLTR